MSEIAVRIHDEEVNVKAVIADSDDNLVKTYDVKTLHHKHVAKEVFGVDLSDELIAATWGKGLKVELQAFYGGEDTDEAHAERLAAFNQYDPEFPKEIQPGAVDFISYIGRRGIYQGVVSSLITDNVRNDLSLAGVPIGNFSFIHGSDLTEPYVKPAKQAFEPALAVLAQRGIAPNEAMYYGDSMGDAKGAEAVGMHFIGVATGKVAVGQFVEAGFDAVPNLAELRQRFV